MYVEIVIWLLLMVFILLIVPILLYMYISKKDVPVSNDFLAESKNVIDSNNNKQKNSNMEIFVVVTVCLSIGWMFFMAVRNGVLS